MERTHRTGRRLATTTGQAMWEDWFATTWEVAGLTLLSTVAMVGSVLITTRITGLRSFSKMSSFDFAITVAVGSLLASVSVLRDASLARGVVVLAGLYLTQTAIALWRVYANGGRYVDNTPLLLMAGDEMIDDHLRRARVTRADVQAKLREAGVLTYDEVVAVVLETTGDVSVLTGDRAPEPDLLDGVVGAERLQRSG